MKARNYNSLTPEKKKIIDAKHEALLALLKKIEKDAKAEQNVLEDMKEALKYSTELEAYYLEYEDVSIKLRGMHWFLEAMVRQEEYRSEFSVLTHKHFKSDSEQKIHLSKKAQDFSQLIFSNFKQGFIGLNNYVRDVEDVKMKEVMNKMMYEEIKLWKTDLVNFNSYLNQIGKDRSGRITQIQEIVNAGINYCDQHNFALF